MPLAGLRGRLLLLVFLAVLPAFALIGLSARDDRRHAVEEAERQTRQTAMLIVNEQQRLIDQGAALLDLLSKLPLVRDADLLPRCGAALARIRAQNPRYGNIGMVDARGNLLCSALPFKPGLNVADRSWFQRALHSRGPAIGDYLVGRISGQPSLTLSLPVTDDAGELRAVLFTALDLSWLAEFTHRLDLPPRSVLVVVDAKGTMLVRHPDPEGKAAGKPAPEHARHANIAGDGCRGFTELTGSDGVLRLTAIEPLKRFDGECVYVRVGVPKDDVFAPVGQRMQRNIAAIALVALLAALAAWFGGDALVIRRLRTLGGAAERLGSGDLSARSGLASSPDEIGQLARCFDAMAEGIATREARLIATDHALDRVNRALTVLSGGNRTMLHADNEATLLDEMCRVIVDRGGYAMAWVGYTQDEPPNRIVPVARFGVDVCPIWDPEHPPEAATGIALRTLKPAIFRVANGIALRCMRESQCSAALALPLLIDGRAFGVLSICTRESNAFDAEEVELLGEAAADLAFGVARLRDQARRLAAEEASRIKSEFLASMSHELRTPLNAIIGFSEVLKDGLVGELGAQQREYVTDIFVSGRHLLALINDILDLSKVEAGKMSLDLEAVEVGGLLESCMAIIREKAAAHRIELQQVTDAPAEALLLDPRKTKQIVYNLLSNAVKFTADGGRISLRARRVARAEVEQWHSPQPASIHLPLPTGNFVEYLEISIEDNGIGIAAADAPRLFQPFCQLDASLARRFEGTGLGLAMVMKLAELHGGTVAVASTPGSGSCFTVWLPWRDSDAPAAAVPAPTAAAGGDAIALVVEDNDSAAELVRLQLEAEGMRVLRVASAEAALDRLDTLHPRVIVLDIMLPGIDGWDFLSRIKQPESPWAAVPVVIASIVADANKGFSLGAAQVLQKPAGREALAAALEQLGLHGKGSRTVKVLVVDDDPKAVELVATCLAALGCKILRAYGGDEGIALARSELPNVMVLDLLMPEVSGFDVVAALQAAPDTAAIPVIVVTAKTVSEDERRQLNGHVTTIIEKTEFSAQRFGEEVRRALAGHRETAS